MRVRRPLADKYRKSTQGMLKSTFSELQRCRWQYESNFIRFASQICEIMRNFEKIRTYSSSRSSKVIVLCANRKRICDFLLVIVTLGSSSKIWWGCDLYGVVARVVTIGLGIGMSGLQKYMMTSSLDIDAFSSKIACFPHPTLVWRPIEEECPAIST